MEETEEFLPPVPLETLGDVRRAMAKVCNELRTGQMPLKLGNALMFGYSQLAHLMQDARDSKYQKQLRTLWDAHQKSQAQPQRQEGSH